LSKKAIKKIIFLWDKKGKIMLTEDCERIINLGDDNWETPYLSEEDDSIIQEKHSKEEKNKENI